MEKTAIKNFAIEARKILMRSAEVQAGLYGVTKDGCANPIQKGAGFEVYQTVAGTENRIYGDDISKRRDLVDAVNEIGFAQVMEKAAYTWFNRLIAIRFMEVNDYLPTRTRVLSSATGSKTPDIVTEYREVNLNLTDEDLEKVQMRIKENKYDDAFEYLFVKQCKELKRVLPKLFKKTDDYMELLLKLSYINDGVVRMLVDTIPECNFNIQDEGQVEIIGKKYQWITMYNILARISDYYPMKNRFSMEEERVLYDGPWEPYVKDFDPTLNEHNLSCDDAPYFQQVDNHIKKSIQEKNYVKDDMTFDEDKWVKSSSIFWKYQKDDLLLTDDAGNQWIVLSKYADTGREDLAFDKLLIWNWLYGYFVTDQQLTILKEYANKKVNLINSDIAEIPESYTLYNREYPWSSGSKSVLDWQWKTMELETGETKLVESIVEEPQFSWVDALLKAYSGEEGDVKAEQESEKKIDEFNIPTVTKTYKREEPVTIKLERILNATQDLLWEEEFDASKEEVLSYSYPCAEIINTLELRQNKYDGYYYDVNNELIAFDTDLTNQKAGLIIRKDALDKFLKLKKFHLVWFVNASKEIHDESRRITKFKDWTGLLEYTGDSIQGEYYIVES